MMRGYEMYGRGTILRYIAFIRMVNEGGLRVKPERRTIHYGKYGFLSSVFP